MTYELINADTANSLAAFGSRDEAEEALARLSALDDHLARDLVIVAFDDDGLAVIDGTDAAPAAAEVIEAFSARSRIVGD